MMHEQQSLKEALERRALFNRLRFYIICPLEEGSLLERYVGSTHPRTEKNDPTEEGPRKR